MSSELHYVASSDLSCIRKQNFNLHLRNNLWKFFFFFKGRSIMLVCYHLIYTILATILMYLLGFTQYLLISIIDNKVPWDLSMKGFILSISWLLRTSVKFLLIKEASKVPGCWFKDGVLLYLLHYSRHQYPH